MTTEQKPRPRISTRRVYVILAIFALFVLLISGRVIQMQVVRSATLQERAVAERYVVDTVPAQRGVIYDANGLVLATNVPSARVWGIISQIDDPRATAEALAPHLGLTPQDVLDRLQTPDAEWVLLGQQISTEAVNAIDALDLEGIQLESQPGRVYPNGSFAAHVLGFTNYKLEGNYGIEGAYDTVVGGTPGKLAAQRDGQGNVIALSQSTWNPPQDGSDLVLTIDAGVQRMIEEVLAETIEEQQASGGTIIVQDPDTGAILGMASMPTFDPNEFAEASDISVFTNPAVSRIYEPGSTFKSIVMAIAINEGVVTPETTYNDAPGYIEVPGHPPITNNMGHVYGIQTMTDVLVRSENLGAVFAAKQIGIDRLYKELSAFGIGKPTGVDLQGEERGILTKPWEDGWSKALFYTTSFGQGVATTPLQIVNAYSAIVNGGKLMVPYVVAEEHQPDGDVVVHEPEVERQVISPESSATMREMLHQVVEQRYEAYPQVPGYNIGAKTGTAQIPSPDGGYIEDATIASIVGFGPVEDPQFTVLVKIDRPQKSPWGETAAGPALGKVLHELFQLYGIPPTEGVQ